MAEKERIQGKKLVYLYRIMKNAATKTGTVLAFTTENSRTKSRDSDTTATKDGTIRTPGTVEGELTATSFLVKGDTFIAELEDALTNADKIEIWEANLDEPGTGENKFKGMYFHGYLTELEFSSDAEDYVEVSLTFALEGNGALGSVTVSVEQQNLADYAFKDTTAGGTEEV